MCNKTEVAVGLSISLTGKCRPLGQQALQGIRLWQSYINAQGGIAVRNGEKRSIRLVWYDDRSQISFARKNVFQLLRADHIDILLGPYSSSLTMAVAEIAEEHKKVLWNYGGSSDDIFSHGRRRLVGIASPASDYLRALPHWLTEEHPALRRICVLYSAGGTFGWQVARGILGIGPCCGRPVGRACPTQLFRRKLRHHASDPVRHRSGGCCFSGNIPRRTGHHANSSALAWHGSCSGGCCCWHRRFFR